MEDGGDFLILASKRSWLAGSGGGFLCFPCVNLWEITTS